MSIKTQGTALYLVNPDTGAVVKLACPTGITGLGGAADQLDATCLDSVDKLFLRGLGNPGQVSVPFNLDPAETSHHDLFTWQSSGDVINWMVALSDGTAAPTANSLDEWNSLSSRSNVKFKGYIADVTIDVAGNEIVRGTLSIQRSGEVTWTWKA